MCPTQTHISLCDPLVILRQIKIGSHLVEFLLSYAPNVSENRKNSLSPIQNHLEQVSFNNRTCLVCENQESKEDF